MPHQLQLKSPPKQVLSADPQSINTEGLNPVHTRRKEVTLWVTVGKTGHTEGHRHLLSTLVQDSQQMGSFVIS